MRQEFKSIIDESDSDPNFFSFLVPDPNLNLFISPDPKFDPGVKKKKYQNT